MHVHTQWSGSEIIVQGKLEVDQQAVCAQLAQSLPIVVDKVYEHHIGKALHSATYL